MREHFTEEADEYYEYDEYVGHMQDHLNYIYLTTAEDVAVEEATSGLLEVLRESDLTHRRQATRAYHKLTNAGFACLIK